MLYTSTAARRTMTSSSIRRLESAVPRNNHRLGHRRFDTLNQHQKSYSSLITTSNHILSKPSTAKHCAYRPKNVKTNNRRALSSSTPPSSTPPTGAATGKNSGGAKKQKTSSTELIPNMALATLLFGFVTGVFLYSMDSVGRGDGSTEDGNDPLAQLKAEAQEAREERERQGNTGRMTDDEIMALESGLGATEMMSEEVDGDRIIREVAVAAPADIAALEEEANLRIFNQQKNDGKEEKGKKKKWWRFGF